jgi:cysteine synthase A
MSDNRSRLYLGLGLLGGVLLTLGFKDVYPDLERRFRRRLRRYSTTSRALPTIKAGHHGVLLEDHTDPNATKRGNQIPEGIEGCIGNTPLFKIRSLSEATGCEILVKAEARLHTVTALTFLTEF